MTSHQGSFLFQVHFGAFGSLSILHFLRRLLKRGKNIETWNPSENFC